MKKSQVWEVDHTLDDHKTSASDGGPKSDVDKAAVADVSDLLETPEEKKARKRSHWVAYITMFVMSIGYSIVLTGVWPYLKIINGSLDKEALGWVVAANPFGQMIASPLLGWWGNKAGSIRGACITTIICFIFGNALYSCLYGIKNPETAYYVMIFARFVVGVSSGNVTLCRSYLAASTTQKERTAGISIVAAAQALGFVVGPVIQAVLTVTVTETSGNGAFTWDKYTSAGWVAAILGLINVVIMLPCVFQEYPIAVKEQALVNKNDGNEKPLKLPKPDYLGIGGILFAFFFVLFIYVLLEALAEPFVTDMYAVTDDYAMVAVGIALAGAGLVCVGGFIGTTRLAKIYDERKLLIFLGLIPEVIGTCLYIPMGNTPIQMSNCSDTGPPEIFSNTSLMMADFTLPTFPPYGSFYSSLLREDSVDSEGCTLGCPTNQEWCLTVPQSSLAQVLVAFIITMSAYPVVNGLTQAIFSKMLGPRPQGLWMGVLTGVGSFARVTGPIFVSYVYSRLGTYYCFGILSVGMVLSLIEICLLYKRIVPMKIPRYNEGIDNKIAEDEV
ncbi:major facilitator superfamily domain-containing protein 8 isoform X1 [Hyalella azteca]|uniref:Major facilitator superfamily domain-containing protein 8 isoform X1 n=1 Tax=Hyalella azteca TaxID=294128 RepID=A0A8B7NNV7_HYAAZ|nr:major facilitator superfamily domain-containing protein 8 isoform X1 [Hyalella azteca]